MVFDYSW